MNLFDVFFGVAHCGIANQSFVLCGKHINVNLLYLLFFIEIGHDCFGTKSN